MIKILELFGGIGAPRKALINLGIDHKAIDYVEIDEKSVRAYNAMYDHRHRPQSVVGYDLKPDILVHGSPCQDFSRAGKRLGGKDEDKTRSSLMWETLRIIENMGVWKPRVVVWENVKGVLDKGMLPSFTKYLSNMEALGYTNSFDVLSAADFGIPQHRERLFVVSILGKQRFDFAKVKRKPMRHIDEFLETRTTMPGEQYHVNVPSMLRRIEDLASPEEKEAAKGKFRFIHTITDSCLTITTRHDRAPNCGVIKLPDGRFRYLTERESWRLMGFEDADFDEVIREFPSKPGKRNAAVYKMAGNSIVVQVLEAIFDVILTEVF